MKVTLGFLPKARREGIITKEVDGELLVYDLERDKAHCLNPSAAAIWKRCDGRTSVNEITIAVSHTLGAPVDEAVVQLALKQLGGVHLLTERTEEYPGSLQPEDFSRRALVRRLGMAAVLLPLITTITAPTALAGVSNCVADGGACSQTLPCCGPGTCQASICL